MLRKAIHSLLLSILVVTIWPLASWAQTKPSVRSIDGEPVKSVLWVGNSFFYYNNSMHNRFGALSRAAGPGKAIRSVSVTISGSGLDWHDVRGYLEPGRIGRYTIDAENKLSFNGGERRFDTAIFMDCSQCPVHPELAPMFAKNAKSVAEAARAAGVRPVFFMSWAYKDRPDMSQHVAEQYVKAGNDSNVLVIPAGLAFQRVRKERPDLELYQPDNRHPSLAGTYLAAATVYVTLTGNSLDDAAYAAGLDAETAAYLRKAARETVADFFKN